MKLLARKYLGSKEDPQQDMAKAELIPVGNWEKKISINWYSD